MLFSHKSTQIDVITGLKGRSLPSHLFQQPAVVEVVGAGFDRPPNAQYLTLRFPHIVKVHHDRSASVQVVDDYAAYGSTRTVVEGRPINVGFAVTLP